MVYQPGSSQGAKAAPTNGTENLTYRTVNQVLDKSAGKEETRRNLRSGKCRKQVPPLEGEKQKPQLGMVDFERAGGGPKPAGAAGSEGRCPEAACGRKSCKLIPGAATGPTCPAPGC